MYKFFMILTWAIVVCGLGPQTATAACGSVDKVVLGVWPGQLGLVNIFAAEHLEGKDGTTPAAKQCLDLEMIPLTDISQFDIALQQGVESGVFVSTDAASFAVNRSRVRDVGDGEKAFIIGHLNNASYALYSRKGARLEAGARIATSRCGWQERELTEPLSPSEATEALSIPTLVLLPWIRGQGHRIWCGSAVPPDFVGIQLVPVGNATKRDAAFLDRNNRIDFMIFTIERATARTLGDDPELVLLAGPEELRSFPEGLLIARESCLLEASCADIVRRLKVTVEETRAALVEGGTTMVAAAIRAYALSDGAKASIKGVENDSVVAILARYLIEHELHQRAVSRAALLEMIDENGWEEAVPEDLIASFVELE